MRSVVDKSTRNEDNVGFDHMPLYEERETELNLEDVIEASEDDEDDFYGKWNI